MNSYPSHAAPNRDATLDPAERRQRLAVLCALDRARLRLVLAPAPNPPVSANKGSADTFDTVLSAARFLPGKLGLWSRRIGLATSIVRLMR